LAWLLRERDGLEELRSRADAGDVYAAPQLAGLLRERGDLDGLRERADAGDWAAALDQSALQLERGELKDAEQVLLVSASTGNIEAVEPLAKLLADQGRNAESERLLQFGLTPDGAIAEVPPTRELGSGIGHRAGSGNHSIP
jgi:hypothetical protein